MTVMWNRNPNEFQKVAISRILMMGCKAYGSTAMFRVRFFHYIYHSLDRLNSDQSNISSTTATTNTTTSIFGNKKNKANSTTSKKQIPQADESLINEACAHVIQSYRKINILSKAEIDVILKPTLEIAMEDFISTLADRWNKSLQSIPKNNKKDSSSSSNDNNNHHPSKRRSRINTSHFGFTEWISSTYSRNLGMDWWMEY